MTSQLHFPNQQTIYDFVSKHPRLDCEYNRTNGIVQTISHLASTRFANKKMNQVDLEEHVNGVIATYHCEQEGYAGQRFKEPKNPMSEGLAALVKIGLTEALVECAANNLNS